MEKVKDSGRHISVAQRIGNNPVEGRDHHRALLCLRRKRMEMLKSQEFLGSMLLDVISVFVVVGHVKSMIVVVVTIYSNRR